MSHFYGIVQGNRGWASRGGSKASGQRTTCASWEGCVRCYAYYNEQAKADWVTVTLETWQGRGQSPPVVLYHGSIGHYQAKEKSYPLRPISLSGGMRP